MSLSTNATDYEVSEEAARRVIAKYSIDPKESTNPFVAIGWALGHELTYEEGLQQMALEALRVADQLRHARLVEAARDLIDGSAAVNPEYARGIVELLAPGDDATINLCQELGIDPAHIGK